MNDIENLQDATDNYTVNLINVMSDVIIYEGAAIPFSFSRQNGQPLDVTSVMRTLADITTYAANAEKKYVPYEGQTIACP